MIPPMAKAEKKVKVRYRRKPVTGIYQSGEIASWPIDQATKLIAAGIAEPVGWSPPGSKPEPEPEAA